MVAKSITATIIKANEIDIQNGVNNGMSKALLDRLMLNAERIEGMAQGVEDDRSDEKREPRMMPKMIPLTPATWPTKPFLIPLYNA